MGNIINRKLGLAHIEEEELISAAYDRVLPELLELREEDLAQINLDVPATVITVVGVVDEVKNMRARLAALPEFDVSQVDRLEDYALALMHAHNVYVGATKDPADLEPLVTEATRLRERYLAEARALTHHGVVDESQLDDLKGANGRKNVAADVGALVGILQGVWPHIQGKTLTTEADLLHASRVSTRIIRIMGAKEQGPVIVAEVSDRRTRAYTKLLDVYNTIQRAVAYLRGAKYDAETIVPNLHKGRTGAPAKATEEAAPTPTPNPAPAPAPAATPAPAGAGKLPSEGFRPGGPFMPREEE